MYPKGVKCFWIYLSFRRKPKPKAEVAVNDSTVVADSVAADSVKVDSTVVSQ